MDEKPVADISELIQLTFVGLMGAYKEIENILKTFHDENDRPSRGFLFIESLVAPPLPKLKDKESNYYHEKAWIIHPFPYRLARHSLFLKYEEIEQKDFLVRFGDSIFTKHMYNRWVDEEHKCDSKCNDQELKFEKLNEIFIDTQEFLNLFFAIIKKETENILNKNILCLKIFKELLCQLRSLHFGKNRKMTSFLIPIASSQIFYGDLFVCVPHFDYDKDEDKLKKLASELLRCVKKHYVPALALIHEHFFEKLIAPEIKKVINEKATTSEEKQEKVVGLLINPCDLKLPHGTLLKESYKSSICRREKNRPASCWSCDYFGWEESSDNVVEKYLHKLWQDRKTIREPKYIDESLFFKNRLRTDPEMLDVLERFLKPFKAKLKKDEDLLPSILVVASYCVS